MRKSYLLAMTVVGVPLVIALAAVRPVIARGQSLALPPPAVTVAAPKSSADLASRVLRQFRSVFNAVRHHFRSLEQAVGLSGTEVWALSLVVQDPGQRDVGPGAQPGAEDGSKLDEDPGEDVGHEDVVVRAFRVQRQAGVDRLGQVGDERLLLPRHVREDRVKDRVVGH